MLNPPSTTHKEFVYKSQTVTLAVENSEFRVQSVTYKHEDGIEFPDMSIRISNDTFTYSTKFEYAVKRGVHYTVFNEETREITYGKAPNVTEMPEHYASAYKFDPPKESSTCYFYVTALRRDRIENTDENGSLGYYWTEWYTVNGTFVATIETDNNATMRYVQKVASESYYAKNSIQKIVW